MDQPGQWLSLAEASQRLGATVDALRKRVRRGQLEARRGNDGLVRVLVDAQPTSGQGLDDGRPAASQAPDSARRWLAAGEIELAILRDEVTEGRERAARAEAKVEAVVALARNEVEAARRVAAAEVTAMKEQLEGGIAARNAVIEELRERADRLEVALAEARKPMLLRLVEMLRRR